MSKDERIKERVLSLIKQKGITVHKLESLCNFGNGSINRAKTISVERLKVIAQVLDTPLSYFIGNEDIVDEGVDAALQDAFDTRPEMRTLFSVATGCTKNEIEQAIKIIEALKK